MISVIQKIFNEPETTTDRAAVDQLDKMFPDEIDQIRAVDHTADERARPLVTDLIMKVEASTTLDDKTKRHLVDWLKLVITAAINADATPGLRFS